MKDAVITSLFLATLCLIYCPGLSAQSADFEADRTLTADVLGKTLYAKNTAEQEYCEFVIEQRNSGVLTNKVLYGAYRYAMKQEKGRRFTYFKAALENLSRREGIVMKNETPKASSWPAAFTLSGATTNTPATPTPSTATSSEKKPFAFFYRIFR